MLDLDRLRAGKVLEVMYALAIDGGYNYMRDFDRPTMRDKMYFNTIAIAGMQLQHPTSSNRDFGLSVYPIASAGNTLTIRADLVQK